MRWRTPFSSVTQVGPCRVFTSMVKFCASRRILARSRPSPYLVRASLIGEARRTACSSFTSGRVANGSTGKKSHPDMELCMNSSIPLDFSDLLYPRTTARVRSTSNVSPWEGVHLRPYARRTIALLLRASSIVWTEAPCSLRALSFFSPSFTVWEFILFWSFGVCAVRLFWDRSRSSGYAHAHRDQSEHCREHLYQADAQ